jgi:hypothetical protein
VRGTEGWTATLIRSVVEGSRYQSNKIRFVRAGRRPTVERESRVCAMLVDNSEKRLLLDTVQCLGSLGISSVQLLRGLAKLEMMIRSNRIMI